MLKILEDIIRITSTILAFLAALGNALLTVIAFSITFPVIGLPLGIAVGIASVFVDCVVFFIAITHKEEDNPIQNSTYKNTFLTNLFAALAIIFITITTISAFVGIYTSFAVLPKSLNWAIPNSFFQYIGIFFASAGSLSGLIFVSKHVYKLWNNFRRAINPNKATLRQSYRRLAPRASSDVSDHHKKQAPHSKRTSKDTKQQSEHIKAGPLTPQEKNNLPMHIH